MAVRSSLLASLFVALVNVYTLAGSGNARIRDLRVLRLARRAADLIDWNALAAAPQAIHAERDLTTLAGCALLFACAAIAAFVMLLPFALPLQFAKSRIAVAASLALLAIPTVAYAARVTPLITAAIALSIFVLFVLSGAPAPSPARTAIAPALIAIALLIGLTGASRHAPTPRPPITNAPNIILISIDSLRADHLGAYGYRRATSPNIDALAAKGTTFETVMSPTSWTLPAHMTMLTSLPPEKHGVITDRLRLARDIDTLPQRFQRAGYATGGFVSATYLDGLYGFDRGFDAYDDYTLLRIAGEKSRTAVTSQLVADRAIDWLHQKKQKPFFLFLHFFDVHYNYNPPAQFARMFDPQYAGTVNGDINSLKPGMTPRDVQHLVALYDGEVAWVDSNIGRILATLDKLGVANNTIVAITADHGEEFLDHGQCGHYKTLYDEVLRVPLIIRYPGHVAAGRRVDGQVRLMDIAPTLVALAGLRSPKTHDETAARSLVCYLKPVRKKQTTPRFPAFGDLRGEIASLRVDDAKLIRNLRTKKEEFYDLASDPLEHHDLREHSDKAEEMRVMLDRWRSGATNAADEVEMDAEEEHTLRSLGYMH